MSWNSAQSNLGVLLWFSFCTFTWHPLESIRQINCMFIIWFPGCSLHTIFRQNSKFFSEFPLNLHQNSLENHLRSYLKYLLKLELESSSHSSWNAWCYLCNSFQMLLILQCDEILKSPVQGLWKHFRDQIILFSSKKRTKFLFSQSKFMGFPSIFEFQMPFLVILLSETQKIPN